MADERCDQDDDNNGGRPGRPTDVPLHVQSPFAQKEQHGRGPVG